MTMNNKQYLEIVKQVKDGFQAVKGKGYCFITPPVPSIMIIFDIIISLINRRPDINILIVLNQYSDKNDIIDAFTSTDRSEFTKNLKFLSINYAAKTILSSYDCCILIDPIDDIDTVERISNEVKFVLAIFKKPFINNNYRNRLNNVLKEITVKIDSERLNNSRIYSPVEEYRHSVSLTDDEIELSKKYDAYIRDTIAIFGDLKMIDYCRSGNPATYQSAMDCKYEVAARNGWSPDMDKTIEINQQIDAMYNPNALTERVNTVFQITHLRKKLLTDNKAKLPMIKSIIEKEPDKRYLIVSSTGDFCNAIMKYLIDNGFNCTGYHNDLEDAYLTDANGQIICYKSGEFKGQPKVFKAAALSSNNLLGYNSGYYNILCIKSSCKPDIETDADFIIFTTPLVDNIFAFRQRFQNISIPNPTIIHRIYCTNTNEETTITKEVASSLVNLHDDIDEKSIMIDEKSGDIIL